MHAYLSKVRNVMSPCLYGVFKCSNSVATFASMVAALKSDFEL